MKLLHRRRNPVRESPEPPRVGSTAAPALRVLIFSNTGLPEQEFNAQTEKIRRVANYDRDTRSWYSQIPLDRPEWVAEMLSTLFEAARVHGTTIQVQAEPTEKSGPSGQAT
jgi:hypothetical protein